MDKNYRCQLKKKNSLKEASPKTSTKSNDKNKDYYNKYDIKNVISKNVNYIIPSNFYIKNIDKYIIDGKILTLNDNIYKKYKNAMKIYNLLCDDLLKEGKVE